MRFFRHPRTRTPRLLIALVLMLQMSGCTSPREYLKNGLKVGPNYRRPEAAVAANWIDADDVRVRTSCDDLSAWWTVFHDPALDWLVCTAYRQNLTLREAGFRVLQARAQWAISVGTFFPQQQSANGSYQRNAVSTETANGSNIANPYFSQWDTGFNLAWELDFWGRFRRAIESNAANLDASVEDYDDVLVTLLSDVATNYVRMRTLEEQIRVTQDNVKLQQDTLKIVHARFNAGTTGKLDVHQAASVLEQTQSQIPELEILLRKTINQLCVLLGRPPEELRARIGSAPIPQTPPNAVVGIPADLLRRRPDVRRAERRAAAQSALIGVAESEFYPHISVIGDIGYSAQEFKDMFQPSALTGSIGPTFQWNVLHYGRILNNVRLQDARFQELVANYQNTVLNANRDVEDGLVTFLRAHQRTAHMARCVVEAEQAVRLVQVQYSAGTIDFTRVTQVQQDLVRQQDILVQSRGQIARGLISVYRALGGGWQIRLNGCDSTLPAKPPEQVPLGEPKRLPPVAPA
ncbi:MAG: efflux transporter outer membrane subunit [Planctomycetes bacterium]|nr:efflux transporter outer membrane subunit [Planctomycetota bacterium]